MFMWHTSISAQKFRHLKVFARPNCSASVSRDLLALVLLGLLLFHVQLAYKKMPFNVFGIGNCQVCQVVSSRTSGTHPQCIDAHSYEIRAKQMGIQADAHKRTLFMFFSCSLSMCSV